MECSECGAQVPDDAEQCPDCGAAPAAAAPAGADQREPAAAASAEASRDAPDAEHEALAPDASVEDGLLGGRGGSSHETTKRVPAARVYEDESGAQFLDRRLGPDRRLREAEDGTRYFDRGTPTRAVAGAVAAACVLGALFFAFLFQGAASGPAALAPVFGAIERIPLGNLLVALVLLGVGARTAVIASRGREYVAIEE